MLTKAMHERGELTGNSLVGTVMSNIGLQRALDTYGIQLLRAPVGDRYVLERMRAGGYVMGGEQSGHIIDLRRNTTGDGPMTAVTVLSNVVRSGKTLHELASEMHVYPQILLNVRTAQKAVLEQPAVIESITKTGELLGETGRLLVRPSGTEPLIRVMIEGEDKARIDALARDLAALIERTAAQMSVR
ncbi:MAG: hypothetical protein NVS9B12_09610 [Vulcanimicrobiaceae bacterium]